MIVVTGGAGFIGSNLVAALDERQCEVVVCDTFGSDQKWANLRKRRLTDVVPPHELLHWLERWANEIEVIFHLGAISSTIATDADLLVRTNFNLSLDLWRWAANEAGGRLIYASSAATYGDGSAGFDDNNDPEALARLRPLNLYGWSKHLFDRRVIDAVNRHQPLPRQWTGLKFFNVYGPNEYHKGDMQSVAAHLYPKVVAGEPARLFKSHRPDYSDGGQLRDFVYVKDCVRVMLWLLDHPDVTGIYNVGTGVARSFADLASAVMHSAGREPRIEYIDMPEPLRDRYQYYTQAEMGRLREAGYSEPFTSLEDGIDDYVRQYLAADDRYV